MVIALDTQRRLTECSLVDSVVSATLGGYDLTCSTSWAPEATLLGVLGAWPLEVGVWKNSNRSHLPSSRTETAETRAG